jgi:O-antigen ligase
MPARGKRGVVSNATIRIHNYTVAEMGEADAFRRPDDRVFYTAIFTGVFLLFIVTYPYRDIRIPSGILAAIGFLCVVSLTAVSLLRPQYYWASIAFCIYIPFSGLYPGDFGQLILGINFTNILMIPLVLQWAMQRPYLNEPLVRRHAPDLSLILFCVLSSISVLRVGMEEGNSDFFEQFVRLKRWLLPFLIYFIYVNIARNEKGVRYLIVALCTALTAIAILTMKESFDIGPGGSWDKIRIRGVLGDPNSTGAFFVYYTLIFLGFFLCNWRDRRYWLLLIPFLLCGRAMTLANSRGGIIAFTLATLATLWIRSKWLFVAGLAIVLVGLKFPQYLPETISGRLIYGTVQPLPTQVETGDAVEQPLVERLDASAQGRLAIWSAGMRLFLEKPWFGHGYGEFRKKVGYYDPMVGWRDPHSAYLGIAAEMGVFALFFFVLTLLLVLRSCLHVYAHAADSFMRSVGLAGAGMMMGVLSANFFGSRLDTTELTAYLWILAAIVVQYDRELRIRDRERVARRGRIVVDPWQEEAEEEETA